MYEKLKEIRQNLGITQEELADLLKLTKATYSKKENGQVKFSLEEARLISKKFKMQVEEIFFRNDVSVIETK